jgi:hypothetical protein
MKEGDQPWGVRDFGVRDPDNNPSRFSSACDRLSRHEVI